MHSETAKVIALAAARLRSPTQLKGLSVEEGKHDDANKPGTIVPFVEAKSPAGRRKPRRHDPRVISRWWRRFLARYPAPVIDVNWHLDATWADGRTGSMIRRINGDSDGYYFHITCLIDRKRKLLGSAWLYELPAKTDKTFYLLGDIKLEEPLRGQNLHACLVAFRVLLSWLIGVPTKHIVWAPGTFAERAREFGFVDVPYSYLSDAPIALRKKAEDSKRQCPELLSGLMRLDESQVPMLLRFVSKKLKENAIILDGIPMVKIGLGPTLQFYVDFMLQKIEAMEGNDGF
jgi:hypothetical protein